MWFGAHFVLYSTDAEADRAFLREKFGFTGVDAGEGWLIFALPPAEMAVHPAPEGSGHELFLMSDNLDADLARLRAEGADLSEIRTAAWGRFSILRLPGGGQLGLYQPLHPTTVDHP